MALFLNVLLGLAFAGAVGGAVQFWRRHLDTARREDMRALAARRGWAMTVTGETLGRAGTLRLAPRGGHPWMAESRPATGGREGAMTEYESEAPRWAEGTLVLVAAPPEVAGEPPDSEARDSILRRLLGDDLARLALGLSPVPAPEGLLALADADPSFRLDLNDLSRLLGAWRPVAKGERGHPILILSPEGVRLRLRQPIERADQMERLIDLALDLSRLIGP